MELSKHNESLSYFQGLMDLGVKGCQRCACILLHGALVNDTGASSTLPLLPATPGDGGSLNFACSAHVSCIKQCPLLFPPWRL